MGHGKKKWIIACDGRIKRSNDRTKKDYLRDLRWWEEMGYRAPENKRNFCPQCKHVQKHIWEIDRQEKAVQEEMRREWEDTFREALEAWRHHRPNRFYEYAGGLWWSGDLFHGDKLPSIPEPPLFFTWCREKGYEFPSPVALRFNVRSFLCFKCERKYELRREFLWRRRYPGNKERYTYTVRQNNRTYRSQVKQVMRRAKQYEDFDGYDDILPKRREWLD